jgi:hypothetical protein
LRVVAAGAKVRGEVDLLEVLARPQRSWDDQVLDRVVDALAQR